MEIIRELRLNGPRGENIGSSNPHWPHKIGDSAPVAVRGNLAALESMFF